MGGAVGLGLAPAQARWPLKPLLALWRRSTQSRAGAAFLTSFLLSSFVRPHTHTVCPISHTMHSILVAGTPLRQPSSPITVHCSAALCTPLSLVPWDFVGIHDAVWLLPLARPPAGGSLRRLFCMRPAPPADQAGVPLLLSFCCAPMMFVPTRVRRPSLLKMSAAATLQPASQFQSS